MKDNRKHHFLLVLFGVVLFVGLMNLSSIFSWLSHIVHLIMPVIVGFVLAFVLNVPMRGIERLIDKIKKNKEKELNLKVKRIISFSLTILFVLTIITITSLVVIPKLVDSVISIYDLIINKWPDIITFLEKYGVNTLEIQEWFNSLDIKKVIEMLSNDNLNLFDIIFNFVGSTVSGLVSLGISLVIAVYILLGKESLVLGSRKFIGVHCKERISNQIFHITSLIDEKYTKFLSGQCVEACILGILMFFVLTILRIPYASMIAVLTTLFAFVPYVGAFLSCCIGAFLVLLVDPSKVVIYLIAYLVTQFVENQFIYPHVVGTSVGLNALWTIIAVFIGGELMGVFGMIFFIPLVAVIVTLINEFTDNKLEKKKIKVAIPTNDSK